MLNKNVSLCFTHISGIYISLQTSRMWFMSFTSFTNIIELFY